jgi:hypothetical protein
MRDNYGTMPMTDAGTGQNYGADLLFEKFFTKGFFVIVSGSYLRSTYKAWNKEFRSTRMDNFYSSSFIGTKEFTLNQGKGGVLQVGLKAFFRGALRYETVDTLASQNARFFIPDESRAFDAQFKKPYFRTDARLAYRRDYKKVIWMLALDIQNVTNQVNYRSYQYNRNTLGLEPDANSSLTPVLSFQLDF